MPGINETAMCPTCKTWVPEDQIEKQSIELRTGAILVLCAAMARYQQLERLNSAEMVHLVTSQEQGDYARLKLWWESFGVDKQRRLVELILGLCDERNLETMSRGF